jgi:NAD(P)-dependent dehydrogenase (short-subunit alcohol dehydrogenase family)
VSRVAVVTGGSRGVGAEAARALAGRGFQVAIVSRDPAAVEAMAAELRLDGAHVEGIAADVREPAAVAELASVVHERLGPVSVLVNAAGVFGPIAMFHEADPQAWIDTLRVNTIAAYLTCHAFLPDMLALGWGRIINVTSAASLHQPGPLTSAYATSKVALNQFTRHLASEVEGTGVSASVFHPGDVRTEMWADIRDRVQALGPEGEAYRQWATWVDETGGDPAEKAGELVLDVVDAEASAVNGRFLWIRDGLQAPIPSWEDGTNDGQPWR